MSLTHRQVHDVAAAVARSLSSIHRYQNALIPIGTLPPEVLIRVFESAVAPSPDIHDKKPHRNFRQVASTVTIGDTTCEYTHEDISPHRYAVNLTQSERSLV